MQRTNIQYLTHTWNPIAMRCTPVSEACDHCWHLRMAKRLAANPSLGNEQQVAYAGGSPFVIESEMEAPLRHKKPARIGVQFMGDLFHESIDFYDEHISRIFEIMSAATWHQFLVLTKRPERMLEWARWESSGSGEGFPCGDNILLGVTAENQARADERIPTLLSIPAAGHFVSLEPLLGPVDISEYLTTYLCTEADCKKYPAGFRPRLAHVILGGESGPGARPIHPEWVRRIQQQCQVTSTSFHFKQWGEWLPYPKSYGAAPEGHWTDIELLRHESVWLTLNGNKVNKWTDAPSSSTHQMYRIGKRAAGRLLDGKTWDEYPEVMR